MTQRVTVAVARRRHDPPFTQEELAALVEVDQTYISLIESGKRTPSDELKERLAKALGIAPSKLRFASPEPVPTVRERADKSGHREPVGARS